MSKHILIVDDSISIRENIKSILREGGYSFSEAVDGIDGLNKVHDGAYDCIITDINMPNMDGLELIKKIRESEDTKYLPVLVLTTESEFSVIREGQKAGATGWVVKPFNSTKLLSTLKKVL